MAVADACPGFPTDINAAFNVPTSFNILTCSWLLWLGGLVPELSCFDLLVFYA